MIKDFRFNTGRLYGPSGQIIWARYDDGSDGKTHGSITFADLSRGIDGKFPYKKWDPGMHNVKEVVMACYDRMAYTSDADSLRFLNNEAVKLELAWKELENEGR